jgi:hypothetical protein
MEPDHGRLLNGEGEVLAHGVFDINPERQEITFRPLSDSGLLDKSAGPLTLELEDGQTIDLAEKFLRFRLYGIDGERQSIYRLRYQAEQEPHTVPVSR